MTVSHAARQLPMPHQDLRSLVSPTRLRPWYRAWTKCPTALLWLALCVLFGVAPAQAAERRVALLLANQAYTTGALRNPAQDVAQIRAALLAIGFRNDDVVVVTNADQKPPLFQMPA